MDATIADAPPLLPTARGGVAATNRDPFVTGDMNASLTWDGRAKATGVSCEQNETCSRAGALNGAALGFLPRPALNVPLLLDFVALDEDKVLLPAAAMVPATAAASVIHGLDDGSGWLQRCALNTSTNSGSMSHSGTHESLSRPSHLTWNSLKLRSPCRTTLHQKNK